MRKMQEFMRIGIGIKRVTACMVMAVAMGVFSGNAQQGQSIIEVTGSATVGIVPDRITAEITMEEFFRHDSRGDSVLVRLSDIEQEVRGAIRSAGIYDTSVTVSSIGNTADYAVSKSLRMAKRLTVVASELRQLDKLAAELNREGVKAFHIVRLDNTEMEKYNRKGLKSALDAARGKAEFIAENEGLELMMPCEVMESAPNYYDMPAFSNVSYDIGAGMDNVRRIERRYSVKVRYMAVPAKN